MHGVLVIDKPAGPTSADVVRVVKRRYGLRTGHLGTLDPFATGVLPVCIGEATKIAQLIAGADKEYVGIVQLGRKTDTGDLTGKTIEELTVPKNVMQSLPRVPERLGGRRLQIPPMFSAIKRGGVPLYKLARQGIVVEREAREIEVEFIKLEALSNDKIWFRIRCSKGTYLRVLAEEIAEVLDTIGHLIELRRVRFGPFDLTSAVSLDQVESGAELPQVLSTREVLRHLRAFPLPAALYQRVRHGAMDVLAGLPKGEVGENAVLVGQDNEVVAVLTYGARGWEYVRVLRETVAAPERG
ncbi:MAG: tRNA pseudouridine(55) synthase TruB [Candidatus Binatia bacterium]|nr:tRNA pseudouridine(55) synthase TruB [Candidatus Binatia bacterium]